jgi:hypothetical protein
VVYYVVGNKTDLVDSRIITYEEAKEFAISVDAHYWETSVYSNSGKIQSIFYSNIYSFFFYIKFSQFIFILKT